MRGRPARLRRLLILAIALAALAALGFKCWRVYASLRLVRADLSAIQASAGAGRDRAMVDAVGALLAKTRGDTAALRAEAGLFLPVTRYLGWAPVYGSDLAAAEPLLDAAVDIAAGADDAFAAFGPLLAEPASAPIAGARLRERIAAEQPRIDSARMALDRAAASWALIHMDALSPSLRGRLQPIDRALPLARLGLVLAPMLPDVVEDIQRIEAYTRTQPDQAALAALGPLLAKTRADIAVLRSAAPLLATIDDNRAAGAPGNPDLAAIGPLLGAAVDLTAAADQAYQALAPVLIKRGGTEPIGVAVTTQLVAARPRLDAARQAAGRAADTWASIRIDDLSPMLRDRLQPIAGLMTALRDGLDLALALPQLLGADKPAEYLLLAQNPDELRATGGFIGAVGAVTLDRGQPSPITTEFSTKVDDIASHVYPDPPQPLLRYMNIEMLLFRDANWSPDFPTSARLARELYALGRGQDIANVVAFDPYAAQIILAAIGPVRVEDSPSPITAENVLGYLRSEHDDQMQAPDRKAYIGRLANAMLAKIQSGGAELNMWRLATAFKRALAERHLLIALDAAAVAPIAARHGWDGAVRPGPADFLMVVDSNVGYNKVNPNISQSISYTVDLSNPAAPLATLAIRYVNNVALEGACKQFEAAPTSYAEWMRRCYYDYLRVLIPGGSRLVGATTAPVPDAWMDSRVGDDGTVKLSEGVAGASELSVFQVIPFGQSRVLTFRYRLPAAVLVRDEQGLHYRLQVQKQAGTGALPLAIDVRLPARAALVDSIPLPAARTGETLHFESSLAQDRTFQITFQP